MNDALACRSGLIPAWRTVFICIPRLLAIPCLALAVFAQNVAAAEPAFSVRGYYMTFMRMPTMGLPEWKAMIDCLQQDGGNMLLLWTGGAFRSKKFPVTWQYNR